MLALPQAYDRGLERECRPFHYRGKEYLRFDPMPAAARGPARRMISHGPSPASPGRASTSGASPRPIGLFATLGLWLARIAERRRMLREVEGFTDEMLLDLGLTRSQARAVARTPFWRRIESAQVRPRPCDRHGASTPATQSD